MHSIHILLKRLQTLRLGSHTTPSDDHTGMLVKLRYHQQTCVSVGRRMRVPEDGTPLLASIARVQMDLSCGCSYHIIRVCSHNRL